MHSFQDCFSLMANNSMYYRSYPLPNTYTYIDPHFNHHLHTELQIVSCWPRLVVPRRKRTPAVSSEAGLSKVSVRPTVVCAPKISEIEHFPPLIFTSMVFTLIVQ